MAALIQPVVNLISLTGIVISLVLTAVLVGALLMRQLRWLGFDAYERDLPE